MLVTVSGMRMPVIVEARNASCAMAVTGRPLRFVGIVSAPPPL
jgi:hypothetical protein